MLEPDQRPGVTNGDPDLSKTLCALRRNIEGLIGDACTLYRRRRFATAAHIAATAREESSKYLLTFCREWLPEKTYRQRFQHDHKIKVNLAFWFLLGQISVVYYIRTMIGKDRVPDIKAPLYDYLVFEFCSGRPDRVAGAISKSLEFDTEQKRHVAQVHADEQEQLRVKSIYVDLDATGAIISTPHAVTRSQSRDVINSARAALAVIHYLGRSDADLDRLVRELPREYRRRMLEREEPGGRPTII